MPWKARFFGTYAHKTAGSWGPRLFGDGPHGGPGCGSHDEANAGAGLSIVRQGTCRGTRGHGAEERNQESQNLGLPRKDVVFRVDAADGEQNVFGIPWMWAKLGFVPRVLSTSFYMYEPGEEGPVEVGNFSGVKESREGNLHRSTPRYDA